MDFEFIDIRQKHLEAWNKAYNKLPKWGRAGDIGAIVRAAIQAGWFASPETRYVPGSSGNGNGAANSPQWFFNGQEVGDMHGRDVTIIADKANELYKEHTNLPKKKS